MTAEQRASWTACAAFALVLVGCGSIVPLDGTDGDVASPPASTPRPMDAGPPSMTTDAGPPAPNSGAGGAPGKAGDAGTAAGCASKGYCSNGLVCDVATGRCVECLVNADCSGKTKLCDLARLTCLPCASDDGACGGDKG